MSEPRHVLTPRVQHEICAFIRQGAFSDVAAEAAGIPQATFRQWLAQAEAADAGEPWRTFGDEVRKATAAARLLAEIAAFKMNPLAWLKHGPGKETADTPGWTITVRPQITHDHRTVNVLLHPDIVELCSALLRVLAPFPEARTAVAEVFASLQAPRLEQDG
jgi:hypothetical protein